MDDKLEENLKCKVRRKTNWMRIQSVKQVEKRSGVWKKKYIYFKTRPIHMTMHVCDAS